MNPIYQRIIKKEKELKFYEWIKIAKLEECM